MATYPIAPPVVGTPIDDSVTNTKLADMAASTIKGRAPGAGTGDPADLTASQIRDIIAGDVGAGTAGEVTTFDANGKAVRGSGKTIAAASSFAKSTELMSGDDLRQGATGGASCTLSSASVAGGFAPIETIPLYTMMLDLVRYGTHAGNVALAGGVNSGGNGAWILLRNSSGGLYFEVDAVITSAVVPPTGTRFITVEHDRAANTLKLYADGAASSFMSYTRVTGVALDNIKHIIGNRSTGYSSLPCHVRSVACVNKVLTQAERIAYIKGEYPAADFGGTSRTSWGGAWTDNTWTSGGGTITTNTGGVLSASCPGTTAANALTMTIVAAPAPQLRPGRVLRLEYDLTVNSGVAPVMQFQQGGVDTAGRQLVAGTGVVSDFTISSTFVGTSSASLEFRFGCSAASDFTLTTRWVECLGAQLLVPPDAWGRDRAHDVSGNANDLTYGTGVVPANRRALVRPINVTVGGGMSLTAGAAPATIGAVTGADFTSVKALAATRQYDAITATWGVSRPTNAGDPIATVPSNGAVALDAFALGSNQSITANTSVKLVHTA